MRTVVQRVSSATVSVNEEIISQINDGLLVLFAVHIDDREVLIEKMAYKIAQLRIFEDSNGKMNRSVQDIGGSVLVVSQFTLYGDCSKGNRPSFINSARPGKAVLFYDVFVAELKRLGLKVEAGSFGAFMSVKLVNEGPTTIIIDL